MQHVWVEIPHEGTMERTRYMEVPGGRLYLVTSTVGRAERMALVFVPSLPPTWTWAGLNPR